MKLSIIYHLAERETMIQVGASKRRIIDTSKDGKYQGVKSIKHVMKLFREECKSETHSFLIERVKYNGQPERRKYKSINRSIE